MSECLNSVPRILVFDSGVGGLTVLRQVRVLRPDAEYVFAADNAAFPYGDMEETALVSRVVTVVGALISRFAPDVLVIACNTASTLALEALREAFDIPIVGTVPAIKVAAQTSQSGIIGVLATPATVEREYTRELIAAFAADCRVELVGARNLARLAEDRLSGRPVLTGAIASEIAPAFVEEAGRRTDVLVLACTHYPLLESEIAEAGRWPVAIIDPASAIARRVVHFTGSAGNESAPMEGSGASDGTAVFTADQPVEAALVDALVDYGIVRVETGFEPVPDQR